MVEILYEDNHLIAVWKPARLLTQSDHTGDVSLMSEVKAYLRKKYDKKGNVFLGLIHRLDRPAAGIVLLAKTSKGAARISEQIRAGTMEKIYQIIVSGSLPKEGVLCNYLLKNKRENRSAVYDQARKGALGARLSYQTLKNDGRCSLVRVRLQTGRSHQIRAQFAHIGHPVLGDKKYGCSLPYRKGEIALLATEISFETVTGKERKTIKKEEQFNF